MKKPLSKNQSSIWAYILRYVEDNGHTPSYAQMGYDLGYSKQYVHQEVHTMVEKGWLTVDKGRWYGIEV